MVEVTQADRDAAAAYWRGWVDDYVSEVMVSEALTGDHDDDQDSLVQAFARHREAAITTAQAEAEALRAEIERLREAMHKALDAPMIDHSDRKQGVYDIIRAALSEPMP